MSVLASIIEGVREDLAARRLPMGQLQEALETAPAVRDCLPLLISSEMSVIAEVKRSSPSKGALATITDPAGLAAQYEEAGAQVVSVLTEQRRFGGSLADLDVVRKAIELPILRKDFELGMRSLIEVHTNDELERALEISPEIIGVNSRNLKTLEVDARAFAELIPQIPSSIARVAESGISTRDEVVFAQECGATAILVGEALVRSESPTVAINQLLGRL